MRNPFANLPNPACGGAGHTLHRRKFLQGMAARYGAVFSRPGNGICHYVHLERFAKPYATLVGSDSQTDSPRRDDRKR